MRRPKHCVTRCPSLSVSEHFGLDPGLSKMSFHFICFIKYLHNKFNMISEQLVRCEAISFGQIRPKVMQIMRTALNVEVTEDQHFFELINGSTGRSSIVTDLETMTNQYSVITIRNKPSPLCLGRVPPEDEDLQLFETMGHEIRAFYLMCESMTAKDFTPKGIKRKTLKQLLEYHPKTFELLSPRRCRQLLDRIIQFYANCFDKLNLKMEARLQRKFDLLKIVHILNLDKIYPKEISDQIKVIGQSAELQYYLHYYRTYGYDIYLGVFRRVATEEAIISKVYI